MAAGIIAQRRLCIGAVILLSAAVFSGCARQDTPVRASPPVLAAQLPSSTAATELTIPDFSFTLPPRESLALPASTPSGIVVPHHALAAELIANAYARVRPGAYRQVVLISPDHFAQGNGDIHWAALRTQTSYGIVPSAGVPSALREYPAFTAEQAAREHGLALHLPFLARYLPDTPVLMVAVRDGADPAVLETIVNMLPPTGTLVVLSLDFSHELPAQWAEFHDRASLTALTAADPAAIADLEIDNLAAMRLFLLTMKKFGTQRFTLFANDNGATLNPAGNYPAVTSYVTGAYGQGAPEPAAGLSLTFTGDVMLDRKVYANAKRAGTLNYPFEKIPRVLTGDDFTIVNHEGPMTKLAYHASPTDPNNVTFNFDAAYAPFLRKSGMEIFSLANNHTQNMGADGLATTRMLLSGAGGKIFGDPRRVDGALTLAAHGQRVALTAIYDTSSVDYFAAAQNLQKISSSTFAVVYMHWGIEYDRAFSRRQRTIAHGLIDAGADLVVGSGPHVLQPVEVYQDKAIFYSLGNFIFDQDWSVGTQQGAALGTRLEGTHATYYLLPVQMLAGQVRVAEPEYASTTLQFFADTFVGPSDLGRSLRQGKMVLSNQE
ncbi:MAG: AmmeMemoRadiSam system protein B [Patescibacteria group bacterium]|nr:AmmeMemoRadiSam system protein B [Patescibacteria group bacterium]